MKRAFSLREKYEICLERRTQLEAGKKLKLEEFGLLFPGRDGKGISTSTLSDILSKSKEILMHPPTDGSQKKKSRAPLYPMFEAFLAEWIVASMLTLETEDVMDQVAVLDPGVAESAEAWLKFNEDAVIYNRNPDVLPVSTIIQAGIPQSMQPSSIVDSEEILATLPAEPPKVPTVSEAISQLDDLATFFQSLSVSALSFPYSQRQIQVSDMVETVLQARDGLKHYQATTKVQKQLRDFWPTQ